MKKKLSTKKTTSKKAAPKKAVKKLVRTKADVKKSLERKIAAGSMWNDFVFSTLEKTQKLYTTNQLITLSKKKLNLRGYNDDQIRLGVARVLSRHEANSGRLKTHRVDGERAGYYGLADWFGGKALKPKFAGQFKKKK